MRASLSTSNSNRKTAIRFVVFCLGLLFLIYVVGKLFSLIYSQPREVPQWSTYAQNIDVLVVGTSQAEYGINTRYMYKQTGEFSFNASSAGQQMDSSYYLLKDVLKKNNPKLVVIDIYWRALDQSVDFSQLAANYERILHKEV